jgi:hypothetical protein
LPTDAPAHGAVGPHVGRAHREVVEDRSDDQWHGAARGGKTDAARLQVGHDAKARLESERATSGEDGTVDPGGDVSRVEEVEAEEARGAAAHLDGRHRPGGAEDRRAPGDTDEVGGVAHQ